MKAIFNVKPSTTPFSPKAPKGPKAPKSGKPGFTLIEILIVVIILGILAAIVIPQFAGASQDARTQSLRSTVQTLRSQIALYKLQHGDTLPGLTANSGNNWTLLTSTSTYQGQNVGPYMQSIPVNPLTNASVVKNGNGSAAVAGCDYVYDYAAGAGTGNIWGTSNTATGVIVP
jgi:general secretion pathway protein G